MQVFVAGATGRLGARIVRQLLLESPQLRVRAGVRDATKAAEYLRTAVGYGLLPADAARRVQLVELDLTDPDTIAPAIGNAGKVGPPAPVCLSDMVTAVVRKHACVHYCSALLTHQQTGRGAMLATHAWCVGCLLENFHSPEPTTFWP
jgi:nucleoside-diphosphate-sugar epimerase